ncbi:hypothetical protein [Niveibacterium umoris]|uniref:hypothetical protein n=1 Tax=Niveibacterium umoris TaxID=1193620 RepID=UPI00161096C2|nr:hypothetical protein [Niveibacterium umoris]
MGTAMDGRQGGKRVMAALLIGGLMVVAALATRASDRDGEQGTPADTQVRRIAAVDALQGHVQLATEQLVQLLVTPEREQRVPIYARIDEENAQADKALADLAALSASPQERAHLSALQDLRARYGELYTASVEEIELNGAKGALAQFWSETRGALMALTQATAHAVDDERARLKALRAGEAVVEREAWMRAGLAALAVLLAAGLGRLLSHHRGAARLQPSVP